MYIDLHVKYPLFLTDFKKLKFSRQIFEKYQIWNFMKICPVGTDLYHAYGQTDMTKLIAPFRNFAKAPKNLEVASELGAPAGWHEANSTQSTHKY